jgi:protein-L-isoaspartate(D-aspartate) O-methyltransferase
MRTSWGSLGLAALAATCSGQEGASSAAPAVPPVRSPRTPPNITVEERQAERNRLVDTTLVSEGIRDARVLAAMRKVPRHRFVPARLQSAAYDDRALPIGHGQTISQPYVVAFMTEAAKPGSLDRCLEIGTGSGYQAAVLAEVCGTTYSIEYLEPVARIGEQNLRAAGYGPNHVILRTGDGYRGWPESAPFDVILVTAAPKNVPPPLLDQLALGGRLVIPVGSQGAGQSLERWIRLRPGRERDAFRVEHLLDVLFVPFLGEGAAPQPAH